MNTRTFIKSVTGLLLAPWKALASECTPRRYEVFPRLPEECIGLWMTSEHPTDVQMGAVKVIRSLEYEDDVLDVDGGVVHLHNFRRHLFWGETLDGKKILLCLDGPWTDLPVFKNIRFWNRP